MGQDRTTEFFAAVQTLNQAQRTQRLVQRGKPKDVSSRSQFAKTASDIAKYLHQTILKLEKLTKCKLTYKCIYQNKTQNTKNTKYKISKNINIK